MHLVLDGSLKVEDMIEIESVSDSAWLEIR